MFSGDDPRPGFRWPVTVAQTIAAPPETVWNAIAKPGNLELGHGRAGIRVVRDPG